MVRTRQPTIDRAMTIVGEEIEIVRREQRAFDRFLDRLSDVQVTDRNPVESADNGPTMLVTGTSEPSECLQTIQQAYRETVMAVPHYEREYGDTLEENVAAEFGETLAAHVANGQTIPPPLYDALVEASEQTRNDRRDFLRMLRRERDSLQETGTELNQIESRAVELDGHIAAASHSDTLASIDDELATLENRCTDLATRRQETVHGRSVKAFSGVDEVSLVQYLYANMETVTPALSDVADCLDVIYHQRERCLR